MRKRFHWLKRPKIRMDWSKWNLYNMSQVNQGFRRNGTYFQQKWGAKSATRAYHGEHIREGQWEIMFDRRLPAVQPMNSDYLARNDGSEIASGRGAGVEELNSKTQDMVKKGMGDYASTPYMQMTYGPMERRLDIAVFRALFASSTRQARQFVVHGFVKVNGKRMIYPGYLLNPGDMFQVEPERVLFATGARKDQHRYGPKPPRVYPLLEGQQKNRNRRDSKAAATEKDEADTEQGEEIVEEALEDDAGVEALSKASEAKEPVKKEIKALMLKIKKTLDETKDLSAKRKIEFRALHKEVKRSLSRNTTTAEDVANLQTQFTAIQAKLPSVKEETQKREAAEQKLEADAQEAKDQKFRAALLRAEENPIDPTKPYRTPWRPRDYMSAFAFIPRYLEVNQKICSAVYLRHPVARPGSAEVPTPFNVQTGQLAFNWYLRRR